MATLVPVHKDILFQFVDKVSSSGNFREETNWGFAIKEDASQGGDCHRIVKVIAAGPECKIVKKGMTVVVEKLMWTKQFNICGVQCWKTDESKIIAIVE